jgi:hypothetical protein
MEAPDLLPPVFPNVDCFLWHFDMVHDFYRNARLGDFDYEAYYIASCIDYISHVLNEVDRDPLYRKRSRPGSRLLIRELTEMAAELRTNSPPQLYDTMLGPEWAIEWF